MRTYSRAESENPPLEPVSWPAKWYQTLNVEGEMTLRTGKLVTGSVTTQSKAVCIRE